MLVARRFVLFDFNLKAEALILAALGLRWPRVRGNEKWRKRFFVLPNLRFSHPDHSGLPEAPPGVEEDRWPPGIATCYPRSVNRNIFYIIGVIVVIFIVLKVLHVF